MAISENMCESHVSLSDQQISKIITRSSFLSLSEGFELSSFCAPAIVHLERCSPSSSEFKDRPLLSVRNLGCILERF